MGLNVGQHSWFYCIFYWLIILECRFLYISSISFFAELYPHLELWNLLEGVILFPRIAVSMSLTPVPSESLDFRCVIFYLPAFFCCSEFDWMNMNFSDMHGYVPHPCLFLIIVRRGFSTHKFEVMDRYKPPCKYWQLSPPICKTSKSSWVLSHLSCSMLLLSTFTVLMSSLDYL